MSFTLYFMRVSFILLFLFPPDEHCESRQDSAQNQTVGEVNGSMYFCDHI
jgi:hypothetical protein